MKKLVYDQRPRRRIEVLGDQTPSFPEDFNRRLQAFDKDLIVVWHLPPHMRQKPGRWKIERCTRHFGKGFDLSGRPLHDHTCQRVYIMMCQDEDLTPMPLGDWVFEKLRQMRQNWEALGGDTPEGIEKAIAISNAIDDELAAKREAASDDMIEHNRRFNRVQFNKLLQLVERHDMRPNK